MNQPKEKRRKLNTTTLMIIASLILVMISVYNLVKDQDRIMKEGFIHSLDGEGFAVNHEAMIPFLTGNVSENESKNREESNSSNKTIKHETAKELIHEFPSGCGVYQFGDQYYIKKKEDINLKITNDFPIFLNHGAYLYLFHPDFSFLTGSFTTMPAREGTFINDGKVFNQEGKQESTNDILLLKLPNQYYITTKKLQIKIGNTIETIGTNSVVLWGEDSIIWCNLGNQPFEKRELALLHPMTMIEFGESWYTYDVFLEKLQSDKESTVSDHLNDYEVTYDLYQYYMGNRFEYLGDKHFYRTKEGYYMELNEDYYPLVSSPLYATKEQKILMPCDYVLVQPKLYQMNKLPAMSEITMDETAVYSSYGKKRNTFIDLFLFDGKDTYVFFYPYELNLGEESFDLSPCSTVTVGSDRIEVFDYDTKEYLIYDTEGQTDVNVTLDGKPIYNLSKDIIYRPDGQEQILFTNPQLLPEVD